MRAALALMLLFYALPASANCFVDCMNNSGCWSARSDENVSYCSGTEARCETECRNSRSYGAIAYSKNDEAYGWSNSWNSQEKAEQVALKNCTENGSGCEVLVWYYNSCGAIAADGANVGWGQGDSEAVAKKTALEACTKIGGKACTVKTSACSHKRS